MKFKETNQICSPLKINQSTLKAHVIEITKACIVAFMKQELPQLFDVLKGKKTEDSENVFF